jgi:hypothetical protein
VQSSDLREAESPSSSAAVAPPSTVTPSNQWGYAEDAIQSHLLVAENDHYRLQSPPKNAAVSSIIFGIIGMVSGVVTLNNNSINIILVFLGVFLFFEGIWLLSAKPSPTTYLVDGIALLLIGLWNISVTLVDMSAGGGMRIFLVLGIFQLVWAYRRFRAMGSIN